jgi:hypothetical protein
MVPGRPLLVHQTHLEIFIPLYGVSASPGVTPEAIFSVEGSKAHVSIPSFSHGDDDTGVGRIWALLFSHAADES